MKLFVLIFTVLFLVTACSSNLPYLEKPGDSQIWIYQDTIQCTSNSWAKDWRINHAGEEYPATLPRHTNFKEKPIIIDYYQKRGVSIEILKSGESLDDDGEIITTVCESCSCKDGIRLYALIQDTPQALNSMSVEGWNQV